MPSEGLSVACPVAPCAILVHALVSRGIRRAHGSICARPRHQTHKAKPASEGGFAYPANLLSRARVMRHGVRRQQRQELNGNGAGGAIASKVSDFFTLLTPPCADVAIAQSRADQRRAERARSAPEPEPRPHSSFAREIPAMPH